MLNPRPDHRVRSTPKRGLRAVLARLDRPVEETLLVERDRAPTAPKQRPVAVVLKRVEVVEVLRSLDDGYTRILEVAKGVSQKVPLNHVICIEHADHVEVELRQGVVEVARLRMISLLARYVACTE
jgi:hypothetical protein